MTRPDHSGARRRTIDASGAEQASPAEGAAAVRAGAHRAWGRAWLIVAVLALAGLFPRSWPLLLALWAMGNAAWAEGCYFTARRIDGKPRGRRP